MNVSVLPMANMNLITQTRAAALGAHERVRAHVASAAVPSLSQNAVTAHAGSTDRGKSVAAESMPLCKGAAAQGWRSLNPAAALAMLVLLNAAAFAPTQALTEVLAFVGCAAVYVWCGRARAVVGWALAYALLLVAAFALVAVPNAVAASFAAPVLMVRRVFCIGMFAANLIATTRVGEMAAALQALRLPRGAVVAVSIALRFFPTMRREVTAVLEAMRVRGVALTPASVARHPLRCLERVMVPLMSRLSIVADELGNAAMVRGVDAPERRTSYYALSMRVADVAFLAWFVLVALLVVLLKAGVVTW